MDIQSVKLRYGIVGNSHGLNHALTTAMRIAPTDLSAIILGESGVGKEVFSKIIHNLSPRKHNTLIAVNCGAIPEGTINSELFGHEKGSFTGASDKRKGYFEVADGGTIFLDEIAEAPLETQARLLRVLETGGFFKVGSSKEQKSNVRIIAATNVDLLDAVKMGKFRADLYYRLNTVPIKIPPLRERQEDIYLLFRKFTLDFAERQHITPVSLDEQAKKVLTSYHWPGNVRELKNIAEQITVLATSRLVQAEELMTFLPNVNGRISNLPVLSSNNTNNNAFSDRELMYKLLFDMRQDIKDLKQAIFQLARTGQISMDRNMDMGRNNEWSEDYNSGHSHTSVPTSTAVSPYKSIEATREHTNNGGAIVINPSPMKAAVYNPDDSFNSVEVVDESLSIADKEKELIQKALKKHKGKRKDAALDLGISERTLYRKIKEYKIVL